jgi:hypothetical protein
MPFSMQPTIRAIEESRESLGNIATLDSLGVTQIKAQESAGTRIKPVPKIVIKNGTTVYTPS